jgi:hypothetical protein
MFESWITRLDRPVLCILDRCSFAWTIPWRIDREICEDTQESYTFRRLHNWPCKWHNSCFLLKTWASFQQYIRLLVTKLGSLPEQALCNLPSIRLSPESNSQLHRCDPKIIVPTHLDAPWSFRLSLFGTYDSPKIQLKFGRSCVIRTWFDSQKDFGVMIDQTNCCLLY